VGEIIILYKVLVRKAEEKRVKVTFFLSMPERHTE
jgi:hypothetical protein